MFGSSKRSVHTHFHLYGSGAGSSVPGWCFASVAMSTPSSEDMQIMAAMVAMALQQAGVGSLGGGGGGQSGGVQGQDNTAAIDTKAIRIRDFDGSPGEWDQWLHAFKRATRSANPGVLDFMNVAEKMTTEAKDDDFDDEREASRHLKALWRGSDCTRSSP